MTTDELYFRDFSGSPKHPVMRVDPDEFRCYPEIPLDTMMEIASMSQSGGTNMEKFKSWLLIFAGVIIAEDYDRFIARTKKGTIEHPNPSPIGLRHIRDMIPWIMEVYGLRPTQESSASAGGSDKEGTSSTEPASEAVSTS